MMSNQTKTNRRTQGIATNIFRHRAQMRDPVNQCDQTWADLPQIPFTILLYIIGSYMSRPDPILQANSRRWR